MNSAVHLVSPLSRDVSILRLHEHLKSAAPTPYVALREKTNPELTGVFREGRFQIAPSRNHTNLWAIHWNVQIASWGNGTVLSVTPTSHRWLRALQWAYAITLMVCWGALAFDASMMIDYGWGNGPLLKWVGATAVLTVAATACGHWLQRHYTRAGARDEAFLCGRLTEILQAQEDPMVAEARVSKTAV
jgi:hypothetical protein